jgi:serine/threonine protein phosphatase PrpC
VRRQNEDSCLAAGVISGAASAVPAMIAPAAAPWIVAVADGIGGHAAGGEASRAVVEALAACARVTPASVATCLQRTSDELCERGRRDSAFAGMGATVAGIGCGSSGLFAFHVGDSRVYRVAPDRLTQLTRDDSEAEELIELGLLPADAQIRPGYLHSLTQAVGGRIERVALRVHSQPLKITGSARFLICTDGLTDMLGRVEIEEITAAIGTPEATAEALFLRAMEAGGLDNITLAVIDVEAPPRPPRSPRDSARS